MLQKSPKTHLEFPFEAIIIEVKGSPFIVQVGLYHRKKFELDIHGKRNTYIRHTLIFLPNFMANDNDEPNSDVRALRS